MHTRCLYIRQAAQYIG